MEGIEIETAVVTESASAGEPQSAPPRKSGSRNKHFRLFGKDYRLYDTLVGLGFIAPALILGIIFVIAPIVVSLSYAFTDATMFTLDDVHWNNFYNFGKAFSDPKMWNALGNTCLFVVVAVPLQLGIALGLALLLNKEVKGNTFFRWAYFCPVMLSLAVTSFLWMNLLNEQEGLFNGLLTSMGLPAQKFLNDPDQAMMLIVLVSVWQGAGYQMLIFLSGLKNIEPALYEAASLDGANKWQQFVHITLPAILPTTSFVLVTMLIGAFRLITQPMIMTPSGLPNVDGKEVTTTMSWYIYQQGLTYYDVGFSSAIALIYTVFLATIALTLRKVMDVKD